MNSCKVRPYMTSKNFDGVKDSVPTTSIKEEKQEMANFVGFRS